MNSGQIVVDSSAIIAILQGEPEASTFLRELAESGGTACSVVTFVESYMVASSRKPGSPPALHRRILYDLGIAIVPTDELQAPLAAQAFLRFGKGRHPARLNLGDCFSYALAKSLNAPLLYKGDDFSHTGIVAAASTDTRP